eukprot:Sspe_Gene.34532::Locus_16780_Transcript_2_2_Confidence_0.667_Length_2702::g.34532::m.34532
MGKDGTLQKRVSMVQDHVDSVRRRRRMTLESERRKSLDDFMKAEAKRAHAAEEKVRKQSNASMVCPEVDQGQRGLSLIYFYLVIAFGEKLRAIIMHRKATRVLWTLLVPIWRAKRSKKAKRHNRHKCEPQVKLQAPKEQVLLKLDVCTVLPPHVLGYLMDAASPCVLSAETILAEKGEVLGGCYYLASGEVVQDDGGGKTAVIPAGEWIGQVPCSPTEGTSEYTYTVTRAAELWYLPWKAFDTELENLAKGRRMEVEESLVEIARRRRLDYLEQNKPTVESLRSCQMLQSWTDEMLAALLATALPRVYNAGEAIQKQGDKAVCMTIVARGRVDVVRSTADLRGGKKYTLITTLGPMDVVGAEDLLFLGERYSVDARTVTKVDVWEFQRNTVLELLRINPSIFLFSKQEALLIRASRMQTVPITLLQTSSFFREFPRRVLTKLKNRFRAAVLDINHTVVEKRKVPQAVYFVEHGKVQRAAVSEGDGSGPKLYTSGCVIGIWEALISFPFREDVKTTQLSDVWILDADIFKEVLKETTISDDTARRLHQDALAYCSECGESGLAERLRTMSAHEFLARFVGTRSGRRGTGDADVGSTRSSLSKQGKDGLDGRRASIVEPLDGPAEEAARKELMRQMQEHLLQAKLLFAEHEAPPDPATPSQKPGHRRRRSSRSSQRNRMYDDLTVDLKFAGRGIAPLRAASPSQAKDGEGGRGRGSPPLSPASVTSPAETPRVRSLEPRPPENPSRPVGRWKEVRYTGILPPTTAYTKVVTMGKLVPPAVAKAQTTEGFPAITGPSAGLDVLRQPLPRGAPARAAQRGKLVPSPAKPTLPLTVSPLDQLALKDDTARPALPSLPKYLRFD